MIYCMIINNKHIHILYIVAGRRNLNIDNFLVDRGITTSIAVVRLLLLVPVLLATNNARTSPA